MENEKIKNTKVELWKIIVKSNFCSQTRMHGHMHRHIVIVFDLNSAFDHVCVGVCSNENEFMKMNRKKRWATLLFQERKEKCTWASSITYAKTKPKKHVHHVWFVCCWDCFARLTEKIQPIQTNWQFCHVFAIFVCYAILIQWFSFPSLK